VFTKDDAAKTMLVIAVVGLLGIGAVMTFSTTSKGDGPLVPIAFVRQVLYAMVGVLCAVIFATRVDYHWLVRFKWAILGAAVGLLVLVLIPGVGYYVNGARRWFRLGPASFQPSEMAKLSLVIFLAGFLGAKGDDVKAFRKAFLPAMGCVGLVCILILREPDIGTTALLCMVSWIMLFVAGSRLLYLLAPVPAVIPLAIHVMSTDYARKRIEIWINPWKDPLGAGYHIIQSLIAIGSGGTWGVGLGASTQKRYFLPESSSDFIFAILAEECGLVGATIVLVLYAAFIWAGIQIAMHARDREGRLLATGITSLIAFQAMINIGVVTKALPTKGIPLPFISAGGSAAVFFLIGVGILYNIARHADTATTN
jgi:cell division protein FtsW